MVDQLRYRTLQPYEKHNALRDVRSEKFICPYLKVSIILCYFVEPQKFHICTSVTVYPITVKRNLRKDTQCLMFECHNELNY